MLGSNRSERIALVSMPFGPLTLPPISLGLLKASSCANGFDATVFPFFIKFAEMIGITRYSYIASGFPGLYDLAADWVFAHLIRKIDDKDVAAYMHDIIDGHELDHRKSPELASTLHGFKADLLLAASRAAEFLDICTDNLLKFSPAVVGFTTTFQQTAASLALASHIKQASPETLIVFGGANSADPMGIELLTNFTCIDAVISGEGEVAFNKLLSNLFEDKPIDAIPGVRTRRQKLRVPAERVPSLNDLPAPDFAEYFAVLKSSSIAAEVVPQLPIEASRGCWWGEKHHCTFCGLNGPTMTFRSKSAAKVQQDLDDMLSRYGHHKIAFVDNILDLHYFSSLLPGLAQKSRKPELFFETKANLSKEQVKALKDANVTKIQPGIESFSNHVLALMKKGVTGIQCAQLLKWCCEFGIAVDWNFLWGFPGERVQDYVEMAAIMPSLAHLQPPIGWNAARMDRFSPYFTSPSEYSLSNVRPYPAYKYVFDLSEESLDRVAHFFRFDADYEGDIEQYIQPCLQTIRLWRRAFEQSELISIDTGTELHIVDTRPARIAGLHTLTDGWRQLYIACDTNQSIGGLESKAKQLGIESPKFRQWIADLVARKLILADDARLLALALPLGVYSPAGKGLSRVIQTIGAIDDRNTDLLLERVAAAAFQRNALAPAR